jgi:hypothetical protein
MNAILTYITSRLAERSTWLGLITLASSVGLVVSPTHATEIAALATAVVGGVLSFSKDKNIEEAISKALDELNTKEVQK